MKKRLNFFCALMLLLMATMVVMTFITGADAFQEGWNKGRDVLPANTWLALLEFHAEMIAIVAALVSFASFVRFILNVNHDKVFVWENVPLLRLTGVGLLVMALIVSADEYFTGTSLTEVYDNYFDILIFCVFNLIVAEAFAVGLKLKEEQDLTI
ncbi:MAG: DUF2975 domain-containing protein [Prevotella sp.]|jgi:hypothetical protein|nr:DUF2975 domain-containing protein [Prevotella sp.]